MRRALNYAINRKNVVAAAFNGHGVPGWVPLSPPLVGYWKGSQGYYAYSVAKAKAMFEQAGLSYKNGLLQYRGKPLKLRLYTRSYSPFGVLAQIVQSQLKAVGIQTTIQSFEITTDLNKLGQGKYDLSISSYSWSGSPGTLLNIVLRTGGGLNDSHYSSKTFDGLLSKYTESIDPTKRLQIMQQIQQLYLKQAVWAMMVYGQQGLAIQKKFAGVKINPYTLSVMIPDVYQK